MPAEKKYTAEELAEREKTGSYAERVKYPKTPAIYQRPCTVA